jgi:hypothetical protein
VLGQLLLSFKIIGMKKALAGCRFFLLSISALLMPVMGGRWAEKI